MDTRVQNSVKTCIIGLDVLRALAIVSVVGGHFFMNTAFGRTPVNTPSMFGQNALQYLLTTIGVPLFLMLTGYLNSGKRLTMEYFPKLVRVLVSYGLITVLTYGVLLAIGEESFSCKRLINGFGGFDIIRYGWYINMYVGLFLLTPVLNVVVDAAIKDTENRKAWLVLFGMGILLVSQPSTLNRYGFILFPDYWRNGWVLAYWLFGALIRRFWPERPPEWWLKWRGWLWAGCLGLCLVHPFLSMLLHTATPVAPLGGCSDLPGMALTLVIFLSLYDLSSIPFAKAVSSVARFSLDMYLFSYIIDHLAYPRLMAHGPEQSQVFLYFLPVVGGILLLAWLLSWMKEHFFRLCHLPKVLG